MKYYENGCGVTEFRKSRPVDTKQRWFDKKGIDLPTRRDHRDYRSAVAVCHRKLRYSWLSAMTDAIKLHNYVYMCVICNHWHTSRQSKKTNNKLHNRP